MRPLLLLLLCASGCDLVITIEEPLESVCGPYKHIERVLFEDALVDVHDFSVDYTGMNGIVVGSVTQGASTIYTGPIPIKLGMDGVWARDARLANMNDFKLSGAHMLGDGTLFGWRDQSVQLGAPRLNRYMFVSTPPMPGWSEIRLPELDIDTSKNYRPGNEIVLPLEGESLRIFPIIKESYDGTERGQIKVRQKYGTQPWGATAQADKIEITATIDPSAAVMTADHKILIYAASDRKHKQRIYASVRNTDLDQFLVGAEIDLDSKADLDDTEPWIRENCNELYFRRDGITYRASN